MYEEQLNNLSTDEKLLYITNLYKSNKISYKEYVRLLNIIQKDFSKYKYYE